MKKLTLLLLISVIALGCEKEEPPLSDEDLREKNFLEKYTEELHFKSFDAVKIYDLEEEYTGVRIDTLLHLFESDSLNFEFTVEESGLKIDVYYGFDSDYNHHEKYYSYSDIANIQINHAYEGKPYEEIMIVLEESYNE